MMQAAYKMPEYKVRKFRIEKPETSRMPAQPKPRLGKLFAGFLALSYVSSCAALFLAAVSHF